MGGTYLAHGKMRNERKILVGERERKVSLGKYRWKRGIDVRLVLKQILRKQNWRAWIGFGWLIIGFGGGLL